MDSGSFIAGRTGAQSAAPSETLLQAGDALVSSQFMLELEVYAAGVREMDKILELDHAFEGLAGLRYKIDRHHDLVYLEMEEPAVTVREIRNTFRKLGLEPRFVGAIPPELRPKSKTQPLSA